MGVAAWCERGCSCYLRACALAATKQTTRRGAGARGWSGRAADVAWRGGDSERGGRGGREKRGDGATRAARVSGGVAVKWRMATAIGSAHAAAQCRCSALAAACLRRADCCVMRRTPPSSLAAPRSSSTGSLSLILNPLSRIFVTLVIRHSPSFAANAFFFSDGTSARAASAGKACQTDVSCHHHDWAWSCTSQAHYTTLSYLSIR